MPSDHILAILIAERDRLNEAIQILQSPNGRHGNVVKTSAPGGSRRGHMSAAARKRQSERMREYWKGKRKEAGTATTPHSPMSLARRKALSAKLRAAWAKRKKAAASAGKNT